MKKINKIVEVIGVESDCGASCRGADVGSRAILYAGLLDEIRSLGFTVRDNQGIRLDAQPLSQLSSHSGKTKRLNNINAVNEINTKLYQKMCLLFEMGHFPVVLGGDHSLAAGSVMAAQKVIGNLGLIWVDAHGDFNCAESSPSGNIHGTPLSALTGNGPGLILPFMEEGTEYVNAKNTVIIAARALDEEEKRRIKEAGITVFSMADIDRLGIHNVIESALKIVSEGTNGVYLSFDLDSIDPSIAPGVGTPVMGGLSFRESHYLCEYLAENAHLVGIEMVELNPILDNKNQTAELAINLIQSLLGKTII